MAPRASSHSAGRLVEESALSPGFGDSKGGEVGGSTRNFLRQGAFDKGTKDSQQRHARWVAEREAAWQEWFPSPLQRLTAGTEGDLLDPLVTFFRRRMQGARK